VSGAADTPMMRQYLELKSQAPDAILLCRMGDFYEVFFDDARVAARVLELTLTSRNKNDPDPIPMAGVPYHALDPYLKRLVDAGYKVAVAEQKPPPPGEKMMRRELVRIVTPGLPWDADDLDSRESCFVAAVCGDGPVGIALLDASTGELRITEVADRAAAAAEVMRSEPRELILDPAADVDEVLQAAAVGVSRTAPEPAWFDEDAANRALCGLFGTTDLVGFGADGLGPAVGAAGALISYARETARVDLAHVQRLHVYQVDGQMVLDDATRRNLELLRPLRGTGRKGTLVNLLDRCRTPMGGRMLREWIGRPLTTVAAIQRRQDAVEALLDGQLRESIRERLRLVADLERLAGKVAQATANARDLVALAGSLQALPGVVAALASSPAFQGWLPDDLLPEVARDITHWIAEDPPTSLTEGGLIRRGVHADLDEVVRLSREGKGAIAAMEARLKAATGISSMKVKHNRVFGYFIEVTQANLGRVPAEWHRKQTLAACERYITPELKEFEEKVLGADERRKELEYALFRSLRDRIAEEVGRLQLLAGVVARIDVVAGFADVAIDLRYCRPVVDNSLDVDITAGRHPVVESMPLDDRFVPNDIKMGDRRRLVVLTGPNMAGKSTVMRQVALIALMAQCGSFVPAEAARIGLCDRIFVRVGASDDLARGQSTFMVEMSETASILNQATSRSLILLDEIGRGTSTYDGLSIAWAVAEAVHDRVRARAIFATHYHELVALADERERVANLHVAVSEWGERIIFLRTLKSGGASKSYGIQCARLAGMPAGVVERARELLIELERRPRHGPPTSQMDLFATPAPATPAPAPPDALRDALDALDPDTLSPRAALEALYGLKSLAEGP
jgi:DNA mismatch repair protein MutS